MGQSYQQISSKFLLTDCYTVKGLMVCETTQPIKKVSYGERYIVVIDHKHGLQKVMPVSRNNDNDNAFYQCLKANDCGNWLSHWHGKDGSKDLVELKGLSGEKGYLMMTYQSSKWEQIIRFVNLEKNESDFDAL